MFRRTMAFAAIGALALGTAACSSSSTASSSASSTPSSTSAGAPASGSGSGGTSAGVPAGPVPTVKLMVGGIDKQIYLPYQLAQSLGLYKKYGVNVELSTEVNGGVGAEDAMASGTVDMAGAWYIHTIDFQAKGKDVIDVVQLSGAPGERIMCGTRAIGTDVSKVTLANTFTNVYAMQANHTEGSSVTTKPAGAAG